MNIEVTIKGQVINAIKALYEAETNENAVQIQRTKKEFEGDYTVNVFPFLRQTKKSPEVTANEIGAFLQENITEVVGFNVIKGFLNLVIDTNYWLSFLETSIEDKYFGYTTADENSKTMMIEYSSPNTNKPLHLGHIRNNLLGYSVAQILKANGNNVIKVNLVNDRGIHICKSMLAWQKWGDGITPEKSNKKGDHLVGEYYVRFDKEYKKEIAQLIADGKTEEEAKKNAPLLMEAQEMLRKWEANDKEVTDLWKMMNGWVYDGFEVTYKTMGVDFDKTYYESDTYIQGKAIVQKGVEDKVLYQREDSSIWADLTDDKLDEKLLLRADGTSVYMTQDIGTAVQRFTEYNIDEHVYVVGNEQNYHFQVLALILKKLGYDWADYIHHLSYGMVELPEGKMKSREGTVVDADDLMKEMVDTSRDMSRELGKLEGYSEEEKEKVFYTIGMGALKYFMLRIDPKKNMTFNPKESIDFNGNTGPFIQYTYTRTQSLLRKATEQNIEYKNNFKNAAISEEEKDIIKMVYSYPKVINEAAKNFNPALISTYVYELAKAFSHFYHEYQVLKEENQELMNFRLNLSEAIGNIIASSMELLGIDVPERM